MKDITAHAIHRLSQHLSTIIAYDSNKAHQEGPTIGQALRIASLYQSKGKYTYHYYSRPHCDRPLDAPVTDVTSLLDVLRSLPQDIPILLTDRAIKRPLPINFILKIVHRFHTRGIYRTIRAHMTLHPLRFRTLNNPHPTTQSTLRPNASLPTPLPTLA